MAETTTEVTAAATSTTAPPVQCRAPSALQCCQTVGTPSNPIVSLLLGLLGIVVQDSNTLIGATCKLPCPIILLRNLIITFRLTYY
jgi:hypothetical protein